MSVLVGVGPQVNKFEQFSSDDHQMSLAGGGGAPYRVTISSFHDACDVTYPSGQTHACENITFPQLLLRAVTKVTTCPSV